jgi:hypothetical protein
LPPRNRKKPGKTMLLISGAALIGVTVLMVLLARPVDGEPARFLRSWVLGQTYALVALSSAVSGITLMLSNWF